MGAYSPRLSLPPKQERRHGQEVPEKPSRIGSAMPMPRIQGSAMKLNQPGSGSGQGMRDSATADVITRLPAHANAHQPGLHESATGSRCSTSSFTREKKYGEI